MRSVVLWVLLLLALSLFFSYTLKAQNSSPPSPATERASAPTTPTESFVSQTLRPLLAEALISSESSDEELLRLRRQKLIDDAQRQKEQADSAKALSEQSARADRLQSYFDELSGKLTDFSGSEDEKQAAALRAIDDITRQARALQAENKLLRLGGGTVVVGALVYIVGHAAGAW